MLEIKCRDLVLMRNDINKEISSLEQQLRRAIGMLLLYGLYMWSYSFDGWIVEGTAGSVDWCMIDMSW